MSKGGRPKEKLDTGKWNTILASLLFLSGEEDDGVFNQFFVTNVKRDEMGIFRDAYAKRTSNPSVVPQAQLQAFVREFFKVGRITFLKHLNRMKAEGIIEKKRLPLRGKLYGCVIKVDRPSRYFIYTKEGKERRFDEFAKASMKTEFMDSSEFLDMLTEMVNARPVEKKPLAGLSRAEIFRAYPEIRNAFEGYIRNYYQHFAEKHPYFLVTGDLIGILSAPRNAREILADLIRNVDLRTMAEIRDDVVSETICPICLVEPKMHITDRSAPYVVGYSIPGEWEPVYLRGEDEKVCPNCGYTRRGSAEAQPVTAAGPGVLLPRKEMGNTRYSKRKGLGSYSKYEDQIMKDIKRIKKLLKEQDEDVSISTSNL